MSEGVCGLPLQRVDVAGRLSDPAALPVKLLFVAVTQGVLRAATLG